MSYLQAAVGFGAEGEIEGLSQRMGIIGFTYLRLLKRAGLLERRKFPIISGGDVGISYVYNRHIFIFLLILSVSGLLWTRAADHRLVGCGLVF